MDEVSIEELQRALAEAVDADGSDLRLAESVARMSPSTRGRSEANLRAWVASAQASMKRDSTDRG